MDVQILCRKMIRPSSADHPKTMTLSFLDQIGPPQFYLSSIFYYVPAGDGEKQDGGVSAVNNTERNRMLQESLSDILTLFYPFAGRCSKDNLYVDCNDEGAEYLEAQVSGCSLSQLLRDGLLETNLRYQLCPVELGSGHSENSPILKVQCNMFECGGLAVGVSLCHKTADASTVFMFVKSWATACRVGIEQVPIPDLRLASFFPPRDLSSLTTMVPRSLQEEKIVEKKLVFDAAAISKLKDAASASCHRPSRVEVVAALTWRALIKASQTRHGQLRPFCLAFPINMRGKTTAPVTENFAGNFLVIATVNYMPEDDEGKVQFPYLVSKLHDMIRNKVAECAQVSNGDDLFAITDKSFQEMGEALANEEFEFCPIVSWSRFPRYEADFGWRKPDWVSYVGRPTQRIVISDTADGDGIEVWVCLDETYWELFEQDTDILAFATATNHSKSTGSASITS